MKKTRISFSLLSIAAICLLIASFSVPVTAAAKAALSEDKIAYRWDFEDSVSQNWYCCKQGYSIQYEEGKMKVNVDPEAGYLQHKAVSVDTNKARWLVIKAKSTSDFNEIVFYYQTSEQDWSENHTVKIPLRPNDNENRKLLEDFIRELIETKAKDTVQHVIPQKGTVMEVDNRVLVGVVRPSHRRGYEKSFLNQSATLYYTGAKFPSTIALQNLHYFVPYIKGKGIRDVYEIVRMRTITGKEAKQDEGADATDDLRLAFELRFSRQLYKEYRMIDVLQMKDLTFLDTTFSDIDGYVSSRI